MLITDVHHWCTSLMLIIDAYPKKTAVWFLLYFFYHKMHLWIVPWKLTKWFRLFRNGKNTRVKRIRRILLCWMFTSWGWLTIDHWPLTTDHLVFWGKIFLLVGFHLLVICFWVSSMCQCVNVSMCQCVNMSMWLRKAQLRKDTSSSVGMLQRPCCWVLAFPISTIFWHIDTLTHWHIDTLTHWHINTLTHWHIDTLTHWHFKIRGGKEM
jgi:hypothetical protein